MTFTRLGVELDGGVATVLLDRPDKANAIDLAMWHEIRDAMRWLDETPEARVGIVCGAGKQFTAGIDLALLGVDPRARSPTPATGAGGRSCAG